MKKRTNRRDFLKLGAGAGARLAPTSGNQQPWKFLVLQDRSRIDQLKDACIEASLAAGKARQGTVFPKGSDVLPQ